MKWMASDLMAPRQDISGMKFLKSSLEINFVSYAQYNVTLLQDMIEDKKWPVEYGNAIEKSLTCQVFICYRLFTWRQMS